jgi:transketolase
MIINPTNSRIWSLLGPGGTFGHALFEIAKENEKIIGITSDVSKTAGLDRFGKTFPERLINVGIAEQNMLGIAAAFATEGFVPFAVSFATFSVLRACEPVRHFLGYMQRNVKLVGLSSGFAMGVFGNTHYGTEDISIIRAMGGITILSPADCTELVKAIEAASKHVGPVYLRLTGVMNNPIVYKEEFEFEIGKAITLKKGFDITIIATGTMVYNSLRASEILEKQGVSATVIDMHTIKPLDTEIINNELSSSKLIVSVEEHCKTGGLGGSIAEYLSSVHHHPVLLTLGIEDKYKPAGDYLYMLEQNELRPEQIAYSIRQKLLSL